MVVSLPKEDWAAFQLRDVQQRRLAVRSVLWRALTRLRARPLYKGKCSACLDLQHPLHSCPWLLVLAPADTHGEVSEAIQAVLAGLRTEPPSSMDPADWEALVLPVIQGGTPRPDTKIAPEEVPALMYEGVDQCLQCTLCTPNLEVVPQLQGAGNTAGRVAAQALLSR